jgi:hypothetical protein
MNRHLTEDQISRALAGQSTFQEQQHANTCRECRSEIARSQHVLALLRQGIHQYAERELQQSTPGVRHASGFRQFTGTWAAAAATLAVTAAALVWQGRLDDKGHPASAEATAQVSSSKAAPARQHAVGHAGTADADTVNAFYPLAYSIVPATNGQIVRIEVPRSAPVAFGLDPINFVSTGHGVVLADVLVGEDGLARAVRFVRPATDDLRKE